MQNTRRGKISTLTAIATIAASVTIAAVDANARPSTRSYTCGGLKDFIADRGAVVMNHKSSSLYQRFVAHAGYCRSYGGSTKGFTVPTRSGSCRLKICYEPTRRSFGLRLFDD